MARITQPETIMEVGVSPYYFTEGSPRRVEITFMKYIAKIDENGKVTVKLTKQQTTQLINSLKTQRKRKGVR